MLRIAALLLALAAAAAALVSRGDAAPAAGGIDPRLGGLEVGLGEWAIALEARAIRPGPVTLVIRNRGTLRHGLELELRRLDDDDREDVDAKSIRLEPGQATRVTLRLPPGVYALECFVSHHDERGMRAVLEVREDAPLLAPPKPAGTTVAIANFAFKPARLQTTVGKTVTWRNEDAAPHTATAGAFSSPQLRQGGVYRRRFTKAGTYSYLCAIHPGMRGTIVVSR
jgi:plastocyanin